MSFLDEHTKGMDKFDREKERASNEVASLIINFQRLTDLPNGLNSLLSAFHTMAKRDGHIYPAYDKEHNVEDELSTLGRDDFGRLCEIARVISKYGIVPYNYSLIDRFMELSGQLNSAIFNETITRLKKSKNENCKEESRNIGIQATPNT